MKRFKVQFFPAPPEKGFSELRDWEFDESVVRSIARAAVVNPKYASVKIVSMSKVPGGRWRNYQTEAVSKESIK